MEQGLELDDVPHNAGAVVEEHTWRSVGVEGPFAGNAASRWAQGSQAYCHVWGIDMHQVEVDREVLRRRKHMR